MNIVTLLILSPVSYLKLPKLAYITECCKKGCSTTNKNLKDVWSVWSLQFFNPTYGDEYKSIYMKLIHGRHVFEIRVETKFQIHIGDAGAVHL